MRGALVIAVLAALAAGSGASAAPASCKPGVTTINGQNARVFCGPARATVHYGSKVFTFSQGECEKTSQYVSINIGTVVLGQTKKPHDGTYAGGVVALDFGGKGYLVRGDTLKITLAGSRSRGTLAGDSLFVSPPVKITGSFSC